MSVARGVLLFCSGAVVFAIFVIAIVYRAGRADPAYVSTRVGVVRLSPRYFANFGAELRQTFWSTGKYVVVSAPSPEKQVFFASCNRLQITSRDRDWGHLEATLWSKYEDNSLGLRQCVEIEFCLCVLVQPEMERGALSVSEYSTLRAGIFKASTRPPGYPSAWLRPRRARFRFARQDHCSSTRSIRLNFRFARNPTRIDGKCGDHFLQADLNEAARAADATREANGRWLPDG